MYYTKDSGSANFFEIIRRLKDEKELNKIEEYLESIDKDPEKFKEFWIEFMDFFFFLGKENGTKKIMEEGQKHLEELIPKVSSELEFTPTHPNVIAYDSGIYMLRDAFFNISKKFKLFDKIQEVKEKINEEQKRDFTTFDRIVSSSIVLGRMAYERLKIEYLAKNIMGVGDIENVFNLIFNRPYDDIGIVPSNIKKFAEKNNKDYADLLKYVICHEYIHSLQATNTRTESLKENLTDKISIDKDDIKKFKEKIEQIMIPIEGHAEFFTNLISKKYYDIEIKRKITPIKKIKLALLGLLKQRERYPEGEKFIKYLYQRGGVKLAHMPLSQPPCSIDEILIPEKYIKRIN